LQSGPVRRSGRLQGGPSLDEDEMFRNLGIDRLDFLPTRRRRAPLDPAALAALREQRLANIGGGRGGLDSGLGVRLQGGRVYDSALGVTCHWCRQKTIEQHVECTAEGCGGGSRLPVAFCRMCLSNRHGEDVDLAIASNCWVCPACRGSCGEGCTTCCNCGPCRKKAGLGPTHQMIKLARSAGFDNVHDYLVYRATGESAEEIADRKSTFSWGAWMDVIFPEVGEDKFEEEEEGEKVARTPSIEKENLATPARVAGGELSESGSEEEEEEEVVLVQQPLAAKKGVRKGSNIVGSTTGGVGAKKRKISAGTGRVTRNAGLATRGAVAV
jgi:Zinc-finger domain of monoamine-oxidase A repressor R1